MQSLSSPVVDLQLAGGWKHLKKDGTVIEVEIASYGIDFNGKPAELVLANDVTDRVNAASDLRKKSDELAAMTQQLWQASKLATMGELAASVAHELNNPLATIALRTELLIEQLADDEPHHASAEIILTEVERMASLVESLLQFSRRTHQQISTVDISEEISNSVNFISYYLRNRKINVKPEFDASVSSVQADRQQLRQLFLNLLTNAADAMPAGGELITRVTAAELRDYRGVHIEFIDSGTGIPRENLERIWDSFFTTKPIGKGTGLGLSICRRIVDEHHGMISIDSRVDVGTTVSIFLPSTNGRLHSDDNLTTNASELISV
jgi:signal transduction histidine kinase